MASSSSSSAFSTITRWIGRKWFAGLSNHPIVWMIGKRSVYPKGMSTLAEPMSTKQNPWLMLPPAFDVTVTGTASLSYKFYNVADNKIVTLDTGKSELTHLHMRFAGSSHGWLALLSPSQDLFLYNPISRRHIKLPSVGDLTEYPASPTIIYKIILSCSPEDPNCRAIIIYNNKYALAFCCPASSKDWTRMGDHHWLNGSLGLPLRNGYWGCVYSTRHEALFSLRREGVLESWDLHSLRAVKIADGGRTGIVTMRYPRKICNNYKDYKEELGLPCKVVHHLVVAGPRHDLLMVSQYVACFDFDGLYVDCLDPHPDKRGLRLPFLTIGFFVYKYDPEDEDLKYVNSLDGLALFVGYHSDGFALPAAEFPQLKSNSIYFTDALDNVICPVHTKATGGHDIGIFDFNNKTVLPCYYPSDVKNMSKTFPAPTWFFPSPPA
ncbi:hypothetical protein STAS_12029 [Striga asiatica]|uniref:KIB1-4 beta-propeller domain-containing protein n=1 Tax=Striga asiatica TaxID=4170 RepID=A0A5A7PSJ0_STRAF|nr:hypothetical protein STAS_12029 [Striga asiatica]